MRQYTPTRIFEIIPKLSPSQMSKLKTQILTYNFYMVSIRCHQKPQRPWTYTYKTISELWMNMKMKTNESFSKSRHSILGAAEWYIELELNAKFEFEFSTYITLCDMSSTVETLYFHVIEHVYSYLSVKH